MNLPAPGRKIPFTYEMVVHLPDGSSLKDNGNFLVEAAWREVRLKQAVENIEWGIYYVEYLINGQHVATGSFEVYSLAAVTCDKC